MQQKLYMGNTPMPLTEKKIKGEYVLIEGEKYYKISNSDVMPPFFMSIVSHSDHWMFISSNGALSAGRSQMGRFAYVAYEPGGAHCTDDHGIRLFQYGTASREGGSETGKSAESGRHPFLPGRTPGAGQTDQSVSGSRPYPAPGGH